MKCKRCGAEMLREKIGYHSYGYKCPKCGLVIKRSRKQNQEAMTTPETIGPEA